MDYIVDSTQSTVSHEPRILSSFSPATPFCHLPGVFLWPQGGHLLPYLRLSLEEFPTTYLMSSEKRPPESPPDLLFQMWPRYTALFRGVPGGSWLA